MRTEIIGTEGWLQLGDEAQRAGYGPSVMVDIVVLSTGSLLITKTADRPDVVELRSRLRLAHAARKELDNGRQSE